MDQRPAKLGETLVLDEAKKGEVQDLSKEKGKTGAGNAETSIDITEEGDGKEMKTKPVDDKQKEETTRNNLSCDSENLILIVATLLTTVTYQAVLSPPPYIWKEGTKLDTGCLFKKSKDTFSLHGTTHECPARNFYLFIILNTASFMSSVIMIFLQCPEKLRFLVYLITAMLLGNYINLLINLSPDVLSFLVAYAGGIICSLVLLTVTVTQFAKDSRK
ncbi:hypothetical protein L6164_026645 [Bauhinia variegata]|uniref:Uncharacterized protein n=1 Tax=Bauhinia variegata TaxID=167791 RepID=A0ACB9LR38_BAUVA|nr:hypothetical protein L6164_026645 [Bauhinia variegata]